MVEDFDLDSIFREKTMRLINEFESLTNPKKWIIAYYKLGELNFIDSDNIYHLPKNTRKRPTRNLVKELFSPNNLFNVLNWGREMSTITRITGTSINDMDAINKIIKQKNITKNYWIFKFKKDEID